MNRYHITHNRNIIRTAAAFLALGLLATGCGESGPAETYTGTPSATAAFDALQTTSIYPGDAAFARVELTDSEPAQALIDGVELTGHQYQHGWDDADAPTVGTEVVRLESHVSLSGSHSNYIDNDAGCDTINLDLAGLDQNSVHIEAISLSGETDDRVLVNWPKNPENTIGKVAVVCFAEDHESSDGIVLRLSDRVG